jgi:hypothetical protein
VYLHVSALRIPRRPDGIDGILKIFVKLLDSQYMTSDELSIVVFSRLKPLWSESFSKFVNKSKQHPFSKESLTSASNIKFFGEVCTFCEGLVKNFVSLAALRCLFGVFEAGLVPGEVW